MKQYPSIPNCNGQGFEGLGIVDVFDKLDGQNLRFEFSRKRGWYKYGSRTQMIDESDPRWAPAIRMFNESTGPLILDCFKRSPQKLVVFCEWWGPQSFCGMHEPGDEMRLTLFDACVDNKGWMDPRDFRKTFEGKTNTPSHLGQHNWTRGFIDRVRQGDLPCTFEGVVGKTIQGSQLKMGKAKTQVWLDRVYALYPQKDADRLVES